MTHMPYPPLRIAQYLACALVALTMSAGRTDAAPQTAAASSQPVTRVAQAQTDPGARRQPAQDVSDALGQRLDRMMLDNKSAPAR